MHVVCQVLHSTCLIVVVVVLLHTMMYIVCTTTLSDATGQEITDVEAKKGVRACGVGDRCRSDFCRMGYPVPSPRVTAGARSTPAARLRPSPRTLTQLPLFQEHTADRDTPPPTTSLPLLPCPPHRHLGFQNRVWLCLLIRGGGGISFLLVILSLPLYRLPPHMVPL